MAISRPQLAEIALNGLRMSWLDEAEKSRLLVEWQSEIDDVLHGS